ncbi:hypothetical protein V6N11_082068 [Hibiscus sabdariffa]|uniref:Uncharacterized protein n=1 Tax=Hibiscus sabdariffa TaxID=183260 RepID=A0ABR2QHA8_9ROSI
MKNTDTSDWKSTALDGEQDAITATAESDRSPQGLRRTAQAKKNCARSPAAAAERKKNRIQNTCPDNMRGGSGSAAVLPAKYKFKNICPTAGSYSWGTVATWAPRKSDDNGSKKGGSIRKEQNEGEGEGEGEGMDMVAFSKPPPQPPFLGSLLAFSLFETWSHRDADDN